MPYPAWLPAYLRPFWDAPPLPVLRATIAAEAEGESHLGQFAVGCVIRNRVAAPSWWGTSYGAVCCWHAQFSCYWADWPKRSHVATLAFTSPDAYESCHQAASDVLAGGGDVTGGATYYFNPAVVFPAWASHLSRRCRIGHHDFYGEP